MTYTSEYRAQNAAIVAAITSVTDVGRVHDRPRYGDFREMTVVKLNGVDQIRSWEIAPEPVEVVRREQGRRHRYRTWTIRGVVGLADLAAEEDEKQATPGDIAGGATFHVVQELAGEIADALDTARASWVADGVFIDTAPTQIEEPTVVTIGGGAICWGITLRIDGYTIVTP